MPDVSFAGALVFLHAATIREKGQDHVCYEGAPGGLHSESLVQKQSAEALDLYSSGQWNSHFSTS